MTNQEKDSEKQYDAFILLVEDDPDDVHIIKRILKKAPIDIHVEHMSNGRDALSYLTDAIGKDPRALPDLVLLDLNMPIMDGHTFLKKLREINDFSSLPVCVLTTSDDDVIVREAYKDGANAVVSKVDSLDGMSTIINTIVSFWFTTAQRFYLD